MPCASKLLSFVLGAGVLLACDGRRVCLELCDEADAASALPSDASAPLDGAAALPSAPAPDGEPHPSTLRAGLLPASDCVGFDRALREQNVRVEQARIELFYSVTIAPVCGTDLPRGFPDWTAPSSVERRDARAGTTSSGADEEPDIAKSDGRILYVASRGLLRVIEATPAATARELARVRVEGAIRSLLLDGDRLVAYVSDRFVPKPQPCSYGPDCEFIGSGELTRIVVFDVSTPSAPRRVRESRFSGSLLAARRIGSAIHTVVAERIGPRALLPAASPPACPTPEEQAAQLAERKGAYREQASSRPLNDFLPFTYETVPAPFECHATLFSEAGAGGYMTTLHSFDLRDEQPAKALRMLSRAPVVYLTGRSAYLVVRERPAHYLRAAVEPESSLVHRFAIGQEASATRYEATGRVPGYLAGEFAMDEWQEHLRIVTTNGEQAKLRLGDTVTNRLHVLGQRAAELVVVGALERAAPPADLTFVRFAGPRAYLATERGAVPLTVVRLDPATAPRIIGELRTTALPTQLLPFAEDQLLSIGYEVIDRVNNAVRPALTLETFRISDTGSTRTHGLTLGMNGSLSRAYRERLATLYDPARATLALPVAACTGPSVDSAPLFDGLSLFDLSTSGARERGRVTTMASTSARLGCLLLASSPPELAIQRSLLLGTHVYAIGDEAVHVQSLDALGSDVATIPLPAADCELDNAPLAHGSSRMRVASGDAGSGSCSCTCVDGTLECSALEPSDMPCTR